MRVHSTVAAGSDSVKGNVKAEEPKKETKKKMTKLQLEREIAELERQMRDAARSLEFEKAAYIRDRIKELRNG